MLDGGRASAVDVGDYLDGLAPAERVAECVALGAQRQRALWELASAARPARRGMLVGPRDGDVATFAGRNSLPVLSRFAKRFARQGGEVVGMNAHPLRRLIGPGYFTVEATGADGLLRFDYRRIPAAAPPGWPAVAPNTRPLARPVYGNLVDAVAWVTADVLVGSATRAGRPIGSYFVIACTAALSGGR